MEQFVFAMVDFVEGAVGRDVAWLLPAFGVVSALASLVDAIVPDEKQPEWLSHVIKAASMNGGRATNSPDAQQ